MTAFHRRPNALLKTEPAKLLEEFIPPETGSEIRGWWENWSKFENGNVNYPELDNDLFFVFTFIVRHQSFFCIFFFLESMGVLLMNA
jgi:hypothetical protein